MATKAKRVPRAQAPTGDEPRGAHHVHGDTSSSAVQERVDSSAYAARSDHGAAESAAQKEVAAALALLDGLKGRGLVARAREIVVGSCVLRLDPHSDEELRAKQEFAKKFEESDRDDLVYGASS